MPTATADYITSIQEGGKPTSGFRVTGGSLTDRLTLSDIVTGINTEAGAQSPSLGTILEYDSKMGVLTRSGSSPTAYQFLFGSPSVVTTIASSSSRTVLNVSDATGFAVGGKVRVDNHDRLISAISSGNAITVASLPSTPGTGTSVLFLATPSNAIHDCFIELVGQTISLKEAPSTATDHGNGTDKILFADRCDIRIGPEFGAGQPDPGNVTLLIGNYNNDYYGYSPLFTDLARVRCYAYLVIVGKGNSRLALVNRHTSSDLRLILAAHGIHPFAANLYVIADLAVATQDLVNYTNRMSFRAGSTPGRLQSAEFSISDTVIPSTEDYMVFYFGELAEDDFIIRGLTNIKKVGSAVQPRMSVVYVSGTATRRFIFDRYGGKRGNAFWGIAAEKGKATIEIWQRASFRFLSTSGGELTIHKVKVESGSYVPNHGGAVSIAVTDYGLDQEYDDVSEQAVDVPTKVMISRNHDNQDTRDLDDTTATGVTAADLFPIRYSVWAWKKKIINEQALTLADGVGDTNVSVALQDDIYISALTRAAVVSAAATFNDVYNMIADYAFEYEEALAGTVVDGVLTFTDANVDFALYGAMSRSSGTITIPCTAALAIGADIRTIVATGSVSIGVGVKVTGPYTDSAGKRVVVRGLPAGHDGVCGAWPQSQGKTTRTGIVTGTVSSDTDTDIVLTLVPDTAYYLVADGVSYQRSAEISFNTGIHDDVDVSLRKIVDAAGNDLVPSTLTAAEQLEYDFIDYEVAADEIIFGGSAAVSDFSFKAVARAIEVGQSSASAQANPWIIIIETGSFKLEASSVRMVKRKAGLATDIVPDLSAFQFSKVGSTDIKDFVDYSNGAIIVNAGVPAVVSVPGLTEDDVHGYLDSWGIQDSATLKKALQIMLAIGGGRVSENTSDSSKLDIHRLVDDTLVATIPKFSGNARPSGGTVA